MILALHFKQFHLRIFLTFFRGYLSKGLGAILSHCFDLYDLTEPNFSSLYSDYCSSLFFHTLGCL